MLGILEMPSEEELLANRSFFLDQTRRTASPEVTGAPRTRAIPRDASDDARRRRRFLTSSRKRPTRRRRREAKQKKNGVGPMPFLLSVTLVNHKMSVQSDDTHTPRRAFVCQNSVTEKKVKLGKRKRRLFVWPAA